jgi:hypothetical protein
MSATCDDLRLGGSLTGAGISGGTSINNTGIGVRDWSALRGTAGITGQPVEVFGRPGGYLAGDRLGQPRLPTLNMQITGYDTMGGTGWVDTQLQDNTDNFLELLTDPAGNYLEVDLPDSTSRFLYVWNLDPAPLGQPQRVRTMSAPLYSSMPYWKEGGAEDTQTINTTTASLAVGGNREVYDFVMVYAGDGTVTHNGLGWTIEVTGSGGAVTVDLTSQPISVTEGGNPANNVIRRNNRKWGWLVPGTNSITTTASVQFAWRSSWAS